ncbi:glycosyltransferase, partial [Conexibacter sp. JD483]|uniref:glycosyltransferase n=2 Tax=Conexibacter TaxID=191494 RepID=UPI0028704C2C
MIGYYVHHHGAGHLARASTIAQRLATPLTVLSSLPRPARWSGGWVELPRDDTGDDRPGRDVAAGGALHWAPLRDAGLRERMAAIAAWTAAARPRLFVVDVSCEVAAFVRLLGVPLVVVGMPGIRTDQPHQLAYRLASAILAPWPAFAEPLIGIVPWRAKLHAVGAISRFEGRTLPATADGLRSAAPHEADAPQRRRVLVISGRGGTEIAAAQLAAAQRATPAWSWDVLGAPSGRWEPDPWPAIAHADVVVCHAGQNLLADVASARRPAIVLPQRRPFDEQQATAAALDQAGLATVLSGWPAAGEWPALLRQASVRDGARWERWAPGDGGA